MIGSQSFPIRRVSNFLDRTLIQHPGDFADRSSEVFFRQIGTPDSCLESSLRCLDDSFENSSEVWSLWRIEVPLDPFSTSVFLSILLQILEVDGFDPVDEILVRFGERSLVVRCDATGNASDIRKS